MTMDVYYQKAMRQLDAALIKQARPEKEVE
jgi:hypothetical protein